MLQKLKSLLVDKKQEEKRQLLDNKTLNNYNCEYISKLIFIPENNTNVVILGRDVFSDLEVFETFYEENDNESLLNTLDKTHLKGSKTYLKHILSNPEYCVKKLNKRQEILKNLNEKRMIIDEHLSKIKLYEDDVLWLFENKDENVEVLYNMLFFRMYLLKKLNKYDSAVTTYNIYRILISPIIGILSPIVYFIVPYMILKFKYNLKIHFTTYIKLLFSSSKIFFDMNGWSTNFRYFSYIFSLIFYFQGILNSLEISKTLFSIGDFIIKKMHNIIDFVKKNSKLTTRLPREPRK